MLHKVDFNQRTITSKRNVSLILDIPTGIEYVRFWSEVTGREEVIEFMPKLEDCIANKGIYFFNTEAEAIRALSDFIMSQEQQ